MSNVLLIVSAIVFLVSGFIFVLTALSVSKWKRSIDAHVDLLEECFNSVKLVETELKSYVNSRDNHIEHLLKTNGDILDFNDEIIKDNHKLSQEISALAYEIRKSRDDLDEIIPEQKEEEQQEVDI